jgi:hypothetical protein
VARLVGESLTIVADTLDVRPLRAAAYLADGTLIAVGDGGTIARLRGPALLEVIQPCEVALHATLMVGDDIVVVGAGAWAFRIGASPLAAQLERVDTLSALTCLSADGWTAWAGSSKGRILRRIAGHWRRMNRSFEGDPAVLAIHSTPTSLRAVLADGHFVIGEPLA